MERIKASEKALRDTLLGAVRVVGSSARGERPVGDADLGSRTVLVLGNETTGMSQALRALCDEVVAIPMWGDATSLNLTSAAAILLHEVRRQRTLGARDGIAVPPKGARER